MFDFFQGFYELRDYKMYFHLYVLIIIRSYLTFLYPQNILYSGEGIHIPSPIILILHFSVIGHHLLLFSTMLVISM